MRTLGIAALASSIFLVGCSFDNTLHQPMKNAANRATPLHFGLYVTPDPDNNPIDPPERFAGFHVATDYEVSAGELDGDVPVYAVCSGRVRYSGFAEGYGGLVVHSCWLHGQPITVIYGHLDLTGLPREGERVRAGDTIGLLAPARSHASGFNRKHLHLGMHRGSDLDIRGYVQSEEELDEYIDPQTIVPISPLDLPTESPGETPYWQQEEEQE